MKYQVIVGYGSLEEIFSHSGQIMSLECIVRYNQGEGNDSLGIGSKKLEWATHRFESGPIPSIRQQNEN